MSVAARLFQRFLDHQTARRVVSRLRWAMSAEQAKKILGFPTSGSPTPAEITSKYRILIRETVRANPAVLLNQEALKDLNIAKSTLLGELDGKNWKPENAEGERVDPRGRPTGPGRPGTPPGGWQPEDRTKREPAEPAPVPDGTTFAAMMSGLGNVEWKIMTDGAYKMDVIVEQETPRKTYFAKAEEFILVGRDKNHYLFAKITRRQNSRESMGYDRSDPVYRWDAFKTGFPLSQNLVKIAPKAIKSLREGAHRMPKYKVIDGAVTEKLVNDFRGTLSLLDAINGSGLLVEGGDDSALKKRKLQVEIEPVLDQAKYKAWRTEPGRHYNAEMWSLNDWHLYVNGKKYTLNEKEVERLFKNHFLFAVYGYDFEGKKNLTRLRGSRMFKITAKEALTLLAAALDPGPVQSSIETAAAAMKDVDSSGYR